MWENAIYLRSSMRRPVRWGRYRRGEDLQGSVPYGWCAVCGKEAYGRYCALCAECERRSENNEKAT